MSVLAGFLDGAKFAVSDMEFFGRRGELYAVAFGKLAFSLTVDGNSLKASRVVSEFLAVVALHGQQVTVMVHGFDRGVFSSVNFQSLAASGITDHIINPIAAGPCAVCSGQVLAWLKDFVPVLLY